MKKMMMALAALCVAGAASAVVVDWTSDSADFGSHTVTGIDYSRAVTVTYTYTVSEGFVKPNARVDFLQLGLQDSLNEVSTIELRHAKAYNNNYMSLLSFASSQPSDTSITQFGQNAEKNAYTIGKHTITLTITNNGDTVSVSLDGAEAVTINRDLTPSGDTLIVKASETPYANVTLDSVSVYQVPEPTALALLALGVAGLALRRKAA